MLDCVISLQNIHQWLKQGALRQNGFADEAMQGEMTIG